MADDSDKNKEKMEVKAASSPSNHHVWYLRKNGKVTGPFPVGQISQLLIVGRLSVDDEVSHDKDEWLQIQSVPALIPDVLDETDAGKQSERLAAARRWADERREERREDNAKTPSRKTDGRRQHESMHDIEYRHHRESIYKQFREQPKMAIAKLFLFTSILLAVLWGSFNYSPLNIVDEPDCSTQPAKGVNWRNCNKLALVAIRADISESNLNSVILRDANLFASNFTQSRMDYSDLSGSNLSFAVFKQANLKGANFKKSDLQRADFTKANLSYADFRGASIVGVIFDGADLSQAIWIDGRECKQDSISQCK
ncbi:hypothetical protein MNBD_GAMMA23-70 [hydrothermal vent metagenome]|uniref:Pentapeptide repeat family protein n=1 Tax=hydrothermal vent metagenome TaxID=652676 RepID=A0A3B1AEH2_9ZZZZ